MKTAHLLTKLTACALAALTLASALASCAPARDRLDSSIALASSAATDRAKWLDDRLEDFPTNVIVGVGSNEAYGVDMSGFEKDGYIVRTVGNDTLIFGASDDGLDRAVRIYAKAAENGITADLDETYHEGVRVERLTIGGNDISQYTIYYPAENDPGMLFGVTELQRLVKMACGVDLAAKEGAPEGKYIEFRFLHDDTFNNGGYKYTVENSNLIIEGVENFGCPNAIYRFLEEECGWEGLTYGDSVLAEAEHVDVKDGASFVGNPLFEYFYPYTPGDPWVDDVAYPNSAQTNGGEFVRVYNGNRFLSCHGIQSYKWISEEFWSFSANEQPCYSNEYVYEEAFENIHNYVEGAVTSGQQIGVNLKFIDVSHPDVGKFCSCKTCLKVFKEEGSNSGAVVRFVNRLVEDMSEDYDGLKYGIFAYWGTQKPCKTSPDEDIVVTFCTDRSCSNHAMNSDECDYGAFYSDVPNQVMCEWIEGWIALGSNVYIWHYGLDNALGSNNFIDTHYDDLTYFYDIGVKGLFLQFQNHGGFSYNRIANLLAYEINWDRDMTKEEYWELYSYYVEKEYGDGWEYVKRAADLWNMAEDMNGCWHCWFYYEMGTEMYPPFMREHYDEMYTLAKKAITQANSEAQEIRCVRFLGNMVYHGSCCSYFYAYDSDDTQRLAVLEERWAEMLGLFGKFGINTETVVLTDGGTAPLGQSVEAEAWTNKGWVNNRNHLSDSSLPKPAAPEKYS